MLSCKTANFQIKKNNTNFKKDSLAFELCKIYGLDQGIRDNFLKGEHISYAKIDSLNFDNITAFVKKNGFPNEKLLGKRNYSQECVQAAAISVLLHNSYRIANEDLYFNLFLNEVKKGNLKPESFALLADKYYWGSSKNKSKRRVFYGSQFGKPCIQTKEATNKARIEIGLKPLKEIDFTNCEGEELNMPKERK
jgi:hypothetical protein